MVLVRFHAYFTRIPQVVHTIEKLYLLIALGAAKIGFARGRYNPEHGPARCDSVSEKRTNNVNSSLPGG